MSLIRNGSITARRILGSLLVCCTRSASGGGDWPNYGGDKGGIRYSLLDQIKAQYQPEVLT